MHFGENQLSRSLIGLSPLPTAHPPSFQPRWVRSSTRSYTCFNLAMGRSPRFGSRTCHCGALSDSLSLRLPHTGLTSRHATDSQAHSSKGTPSPAQAGSDGLQAPGFRYSFTPLPGYFSPFPHGTHPLSVIRRYSGSRVVSADSHRIPRAPCYSGTPPRSPAGFTYGALTHYGPPSQGVRLPTRLITTHPAGRPGTGTPHNTAAATPAGYHTTTV